MSLSPDVAAGAVLAAGAIASGPLAIRAAFRMRPGRNVFFASWGFGQALVGLIVAVVAGLVAGHFLPPEYAGLATPIGLAGGCVVALASARRAQRAPWAALGLSQPALAPSSLVVGPALAVLALPAGIGAALLTGTWAGGEGPLRAEVLASASTGIDPVWWLTFLLFAPLVAELWFRGFLQPLLVQNFSERGGLVLSAVLFASLHGTADFLPMLALGLALALAKLRTQSTYTVILGTVLWNGVALWLASSGSARLPLAF